MAKLVCDFCLEESKGIFKRPSKLLDGHYICRSCAHKIEAYDLPVRYEIFQLLITAEKNMHDTIMASYLENHDADECIAKYYPLPANILHEEEVCVNAFEASITVEKALIPEKDAVRNIADITRKDLCNLPDCTSGTQVNGILYETNAALYFMSDKIINCHRLTSMVTNTTDGKNIKVLEHGRTYTYEVDSSDLFLMRHTFYHRCELKANSHKKNLIYLSSENTMTLTSGVYNVPKNIRSGTYYVNPLENAGLNVIDANGRVQSPEHGKVYIDEGSVIEVTGKYQFRFNDRKRGH